MPQASELSAPIFCPLRTIVLSWFCLHIYKVEDEQRNACIPKLDQEYSRKAQACALS